MCSLSLSFSGSFCSVIPCVSVGKLMYWNLELFVAQILFCAYLGILMMMWKTAFSFMAFYTVLHLVEISEDHWHFNKLQYKYSQLHSYPKFSFCFYVCNRVFAMEPWPWPWLHALGKDALFVLSTEYQDVTIAIFFHLARACVCVFMGVYVCVSRCICMCKCLCVGGNRDRSVVRVSDSWLKGPGFGSWQEWWENFLLRGQLSVLTLILVSVPPLCYCTCM